jgi:YD repeat-containing protein
LTIEVIGGLDTSPRRCDAVQCAREDEEEQLLLREQGRAGRRTPIGPSVIAACVAVFATPLAIPAEPPLTQVETYDQRGLPTRTQYPDGRVVDVTYNAQGLPAQIRSPDRNTSYAYDERGNPILTRDASGGTYVLYDNLQRPMAIFYRRAPMKVTKVSYSEDGYIVELSIYDLDVAALDRRIQLLLSRVREMTPEADRRAVELQRSLRDMLALIEREAGRNLLQYQVRYEYDALGRLTSATAGGQRMTLQYFIDRREVQRTLGPDIRSTYRYDAQGRLEYLGHFVKGAPAGELRYQYDSHGRVSRETLSRPGASPLETSTQRRSDGAIERVSVGGATLALQRDAERRLTGAGYDGYGRITRHSSETYQWSRNGNVESIKGSSSEIRLQYDIAGRPRAMGARESVVQLAWDANGALIGEREGAQDTLYFNQPVGLASPPLIETNNRGAVQSSYFYFLGLVARQAPDGRFEYYLEDASGAVRMVVDSDGKVISRIDYSPSSEVLLRAGSSIPKFIAAGVRYYPGSKLIRNDRGEVIGPRVGLLNQVSPPLAATLARFGGRVAAGHPFLANVAEIGLVYSYVYINAFKFGLAVFCPHCKLFATELLFEAANASIKVALTGNEQAEEFIDQPILKLTGAVSDFVSWGKLFRKTGDFGSALWQLRANTRQLTATGAWQLQVWLGRHVGEGQLLTRYSRGNTLDEITSNAQLLDRSLESLRKVVVSGEAVGTKLLQSFLKDRVKTVITTASGMPAPPTGSDAFWKTVTDVFYLQGIGERFADRLVHDLTAANDPLPTVQKQLGGIRLDQAASYSGVPAALAGAVFDPQTQTLVLLAGESRSAPALDPSDLTVALAAAYSGTSQIEFSLDPADPANPRGEWLQAVYRPRELLVGTPFGNALFDADWLMKQYAFGVTLDGQGTPSARKSAVAGYEDYVRSLLGDSADTGERWSRFWIVPDRMVLRGNARGFVFDTATMRVETRRQVPDAKSPMGLRDILGTDPDAERFRALLTNRYDDFAKESPAFGRVRELARAFALAKWMREQGVIVDPEWLRANQPRDVQPIDRVTALSLSWNSQSRQPYRQGDRQGVVETTRMLHLFGGIELKVDARLTEDREFAALVAQVDRQVGSGVPMPLFPVTYHGKRYQASLPPLTAGNRRLWDAATRRIDDAVYRFDAQGRVTQIVTDAGERLAAQYQDSGAFRQIEVTLPGGQSISAERSSVGSTWRWRGTNGAVFERTYGGDGRPKAVRIDGEVWAELAYTPATRETRVRYRDGSTELVRRDARNALVSRVWEAAPSASGRLTLRDSRSGNLSVASVDGVEMLRVERNEAGLIRSLSEAGHTITVEYDAAGRVARVTDSGNSVARYTYDTTGEVASLAIRTSGVDTIYTRTLRSLTATEGGRELAQVTYDEAGRLISLRERGAGEWRVAYAAMPGNAGYQVTTKRYPGIVAR